jgi:energy-converting hydrogenase B subunit D
VIALQVVALLLVALAGTATALTRDPLRQAVVVALYGMLLGVLFLVFQAPDVGLSVTVVGAVAMPLMILLALGKVKGGGSS